MWGRFWICKTCKIDSWQRAYADLCIIFWVCAVPFIPTCLCLLFLPVNVIHGWSLLCKCLISLDKYKPWLTISYNIVIQYNMFLWELCLCLNLFFIYLFVCFLRMYRAEKLPNTNLVFLISDAKSSCLSCDPKPLRQAEQPCILKCMHRFPTSPLTVHCCSCISNFYLPLSEKWKRTLPWKYRSLRTEIITFVLKFQLFFL